MNQRKMKAQFSGQEIEHYYSRADRQSLASFSVDSQPASSQNQAAILEPRFQADPPQYVSRTRDKRASGAVRFMPPRAPDFNSSMRLTAI